MTDYSPTYVNIVNITHTEPSNMSEFAVWVKPAKRRKKINELGSRKRQQKQNKSLELGHVRIGLDHFWLLNRKIWTQFSLVVHVNVGEWPDFLVVYGKLLNSGFTANRTEAETFIEGLNSCFFYCHSLSFLRLFFDNKWI